MPDRPSPALSTLRFLQLIYRLKLTLTVRYFQRNKAGAVATAVGLSVMVLILGVALAIVAGWLHTSGGADRSAFMMWGLWIGSFLWISAPLSQFDAQRNLDLTGLRLLPLTRSRFTLAVLFDGAVSPLGVITLPVALGMCGAFALHWSEVPLLLGALLLLGFFQLGCAQALYLFGNRIFSSRRFSEVSMGCGFLLFTGMQFVNILIQSGGAHLPPWALATYDTLRQAVAPLGEWIAPGVAARAVTAGAAGDIAQAALLYLVLALQGVAAIFLAGIAAKLFYESDLESGGQTAPASPLARATAPENIGLAAVAGRFGLSPLLTALMRREQAYLWRDPVVRLQFMQSLFATLYLAFVVLMMNFRHGDAMYALRMHSFGRYALLGVAIMLGLSESAVLFNRFGYEGGQLTNLLLTPVRRSAILAGKSVFLVSHFVLLNMALCLGFGIALHVAADFIILALLLVLTNTMLLDVIGYYVSIYYPFAYRRVGRRLRAVMPQPGCGYTLIYLLVFQASNAAAFPVSLVSALLVTFLGWPGLALAMVWSGGVCWAAYRFALPHAALLMERREPQLLAALAKGGE